LSSPVVKFRLASQIGFLKENLVEILLRGKPFYHINNSDCALTPIRTEISTSALH